MGGAVIGTLAMAIDMADRRRAEEALSRSEYLYRTLASNIPNGAVALFDRELRYIVVDGAGVLDAAGGSKEFLVGKTIREVLPADTWQLLEPLYRAALEGRTASAEVPFRRRIYFVHTLPIPGENGGIPMGMVMALDITARKLAEEEVRRMNNDLERRVAERTAQLEAAYRHLTELDNEGERPSPLPRDRHEQERHLLPRLGREEQRQTHLCVRRDQRPVSPARPQGLLPHPHGEERCSLHR